jgi:hypothetical protein
VLVEAFEMGRWECSAPRQMRSAPSGPGKRTVRTRALDRRGRRAPTCTGSTVFGLPGSPGPSDPSRHLGPVDRGCPRKPDQSKSVTGGLQASRRLACSLAPQRAAMPHAVGHQLAGQQERHVSARMRWAEHPADERAGCPHLLRPRPDRHALPACHTGHHATTLPARPSPELAADAGTCTLSSAPDVKPERAAADLSAAARRRLRRGGAPAVPMRAAGHVMTGSQGFCGNQRPAIRHSSRAESSVPNADARSRVNATA